MTPGLPSPSPEPLRRYLAAAISDAQLRDLASADYGFGESDIFEHFKAALATDCEFTGPWPNGNPYACCELGLFYQSDPDPLISLFAAWWLGRFCSYDGNAFILLDNIGMNRILAALAGQCLELDPQAADAAVPFVLWLIERDPWVNYTDKLGNADYDPATLSQCAEETLAAYVLAVQALQAIAELGPAAKDSAPYKECAAKGEEP